MEAVRYPQAYAQKSYNVISATFYWLTQITRLAQIQKVGKYTSLLNRKIIKVIFQSGV